jgi:hypothetical protein
LKRFVLHREEYSTSPRQLKSRSHSPCTSYERAIKTRNATDGAYHTGPGINTWSIRKMRRETRHGILRFVWIGRHGYRFARCRRRLRDLGQQWVLLAVAPRDQIPLSPHPGLLHLGVDGNARDGDADTEDGESPLQVAPCESKGVHEHPFSNTKHSLIDRTCEGPYRTSLIEACRQRARRRCSRALLLNTGADPNSAHPPGPRSPRFV